MAGLRLLASYRRGGVKEYPRCVDYRPHVSVRRCLALFFFLAAVARAGRASTRLRHQIAGLVAATRRLGAAIAVWVAALKPKRNKLPEEVERERDCFDPLAQEAARSIESIERVRAVAREPVTDQLTDLLNWRALKDALSAEVERAKRCGTDLGLVLIEFDSLKRLHETHGHPQRDVVLREVARVLRVGLREIDRAARCGGGEFAVILPGTDLEGAYDCGERICEQIAQLRIPRLDGEGTLRVTASCGAASARGETADAEELVAAANRALYERRRR